MHHEAVAGADSEGRRHDPEGRQHGLTAHPVIAETRQDGEEQEDAEAGCEERLDALGVLAHVEVECVGGEGVQLEVGEVTALKELQAASLE